MAQREPELNGMSREERGAYKALLKAACAQTIERLNTMGRRMSARTPYGDVVKAVQAETKRAIGNRSLLEYLQAFLDGKLDRGQIAPPREPVPFTPLQLDAGIRRNFERASRVQRPMLTPNGYGDYSRSWGGSEGHS